MGVDDVEEAPGVDLLAIVDVSRSMSWSCAGETDGKTQYVEAGFSLLDLVKHALKTIVHTMRPTDRLALILFESYTEVRLEWTEMTEENVEKVIETINSIPVRLGTDLFAALKRGITWMNVRADRSRNAHILFFTDGQTQLPP